MKALSIQQPWAWAILYFGKDIENRSWPLPKNIHGRILIHAGKKYDKDGKSYIKDMFGQRNPIYIPPHECLCGGIVGSVSIYGCVQNSGSRWFSGPYGFLLCDPAVVPFKPMRGQLGFFEVQI
jgi:hypothetical protein